MITRHEAREIIAELYPNRLMTIEELRIQVQLEQCFDIREELDSYTKALDEFTDDEDDELPAMADAGIKYFGSHAEKMDYIIENLLNELIALAEY